MNVLVAGRYRVLDFLGAGSFGTVFLAQDEADERWASCVALKIEPTSSVRPLLIHEYRKLQSVHAYADQLGADVGVARGIPRVFWFGGTEVPGAMLALRSHNADRPIGFGAGLNPWTHGAGARLSHAPSATAAGAALAGAPAAAPAGSASAAGSCGAQPMSCSAGGAPLSGSGASGAGAAPMQGSAPALAAAPGAFSGARAGAHAAFAASVAAAAATAATAAVTAAAATASAVSTSAASASALGSSRAGVAVHVLAEQLMGPSVDDLLEMTPLRLLSAVQALCVAADVLRALALVHAAGLVHRDIKPANIAVDLSELVASARVRGERDATSAVHGKPERAVFALIDFGLAEHFVNTRTGRHIPLRRGRSLVGTARYCSLNTHLGIEPSRRDDLESLGYTLVFLLRGALPWQGVHAGTRKERYDRIAQLKAATPVDALCADMPAELLQFVGYARALQFDARPDYERWIELFAGAASRLAAPAVPAWRALPSLAEVVLFRSRPKSYAALADAAGSGSAASVPLPLAAPRASRRTHKALPQVFERLDLTAGGAAASAAAVAVAVAAGAGPAGAHASPQAGARDSSNPGTGTSLAPHLLAGQTQSTGGVRSWRQAGGASPLVASQHALSLAPAPPPLRRPQRANTAERASLALGGASLAKAGGALQDSSPFARGRAARRGAAHELSAVEGGWAEMQTDIDAGAWAAEPGWGGAGAFWGAGGGAGAGVVASELSPLVWRSTQLSLVALHDVPGEAVVAAIGPEAASYAENVVLSLSLATSHTNNTDWTGGVCASWRDGLASGAINERFSYLPTEGDRLCVTALCGGTPFGSAVVDVASLPLGEELTLWLQLHSLTDEGAIVGTVELKAERKAAVRAGAGAPRAVAARASSRERRPPSL